MKLNKIVLVDERITPEIESNLCDYNFKIVKLKCADFLQKPVSAHPDMLLFISKNNDKIICHKRYYKKAKDEIDYVANELGCEITLSDEEVNDSYPNDVLFNATKIKDKLICKKKSTSKHILEMYDEDDIIDVSQGYTKCSCAVIRDEGIITYDKKIADKAKSKGIDVLLIRDKGVELSGYNCGFIGGCCGDDGENMYFCGNIDLHPDAERIKEFCLLHNRKVVSLSEKPLYDYGTLIFL